MNNLKEYQSSNVIYVHELSEEIQKELAKNYDLDLNQLNLLVFSSLPEKRHQCLL